MLAMQYSIPLPADYDMGIIRRRVAERGAAFDRLAGLHFKAFLIQERSRGQVGNGYAPFYLWSQVESLWDFVAGNGYKGIVDSFGCMPIDTWVPLVTATRPGLELHEVQTAVREQVSLAPGTDLASLRQREMAENAAALEDEQRLAARVVAIDIGRWQLIRFGLWLCPQDQLTHVARDCYEVLRLSAPGLSMQ